MEHQAAPSAHDGDPSPTIIVVDEERFMGDSSFARLREEGFEVRTFSGPADALAYLHRHPAEVVVCGLHMPEMNGFEFLNRTAAIYADIVRVLIGEREDKSVIHQAVAKGLVHNYLTRPWNYSSFRTLLKESLMKQRELREQHLREVLTTPDRLPSPPKFHVRLRTLLARESSSVQNIADEIEKDPVLVAKLLRVANSAYYGARSTISSVRDAVIFIGTEYIASLVMAIEAFHSVMRSTDQRSARVIDQLWHQALRRASVTKLLGTKWPGFREPNSAYVGGLLQDLGFVVRLSYEPERFFQYQALALSGEMDRYEAERKIFTITHDDVGAALFRFWNLPVELVGAIAHHHRAAGEDPLTQILQIGDILELGDATSAHDPDLDPLIVQWAEKLRLKTPKGLQIRRAEAATQAAVDQPT